MLRNWSFAFLFANEFLVRGITLAIHYQIMVPARHLTGDLFILISIDLVYCTVYILVLYGSCLQCYMKVKLSSSFSAFFEIELNANISYLLSNFIGFLIFRKCNVCSQDFKGNLRKSSKLNVIKIKFIFNTSFI